MKESDYIDVTNLTKIRIAKTVVLDILTVSDEDRLVVAAVLDKLRAMEYKLESATLKKM